MEIVFPSNKRRVALFHSHVYFDVASGLDIVASLIKDISQMENVRVGRVHEVPVGPHTKAMFTVIVGAEAFGTIVPYLMLNRQGLDVLVHPETGNDLLDHTEHALWLGNKVPLDLDKL